MVNSTPNSVVVNGRTWEIGADGTLKDRRETPQDGLRLNRSERQVLQLIRRCGQLRLPEITRVLMDEGYILACGVLTSAGERLADVLLADTNDN